MLSKQVQENLVRNLDGIFTKKKNSISKQVCIVDIVENWTQPINDLILKEQLPEDE